MSAVVEDTLFIHKENKKNEGTLINSEEVDADIGYFELKLEEFK